MKSDAHYTTSFEEDAEGWWTATCNCGAVMPVSPDIEILADFLMQHAYDVGYADAERA